MTRLDKARAGEAARPYASYWSTYTDLRGRNQFRNLYWDKFKDIIGRPAKLVGIEREELWPSGKPSRELRCHIWRHFRAHDDNAAIMETILSAYRLAPIWRVLGPPRRLSAEQAKYHDLIELIWDRKADRSAALHHLTSVMVSLRRDTGFRTRPGFTIEGGGYGERPNLPPVFEPPTHTGRFEAIWQVEVQTSTKRELMETHWPLLQQRFGGNYAEMIDLEKRVGDVGPFKFRIRWRFDDATQTEIVLQVLERASGMDVALECDKHGRMFAMTGHRSTRDVHAHQVPSVEVRAIA